VIERFWAIKCQHPSIPGVWLYRPLRLCACVYVCSYITWCSCWL